MANKKKYPSGGNFYGFDQRGRAARPAAYLTYAGLTIGSLVAGFVGDKLGRRFTYQINLIIFGLASFAAAAAPDIA
ncbi:MAG: hypothetical protein ACXWJ0_09770, partial [Xanthobacteraceae bacterium]